jgi:general secretion pathway protein G
MRTYRHRRAGFSLVEMLLVLVILATLAAIVIPRFTGRSEQAKETAARTQISSISTALDAFEVDNGYYPSGADGLSQLVNRPANSTNWRGPYLKQAVPNDPWGNPYVYTAPGVNNPDGYDLSSNGPDGRAGTADDITNWSTNR